MLTLRFGEFELDKAGYKLTKNGTKVAMEPLVFDLLALLASNAGRVVSRDTIIETVWDGRFISDSTVSTAIKSIRKALGDSGQKQRFVRTVHGRGFEFTAEVSVLSDALPAEPVHAEPAPQSSLEDPRGKPPSIVAIPFEVIGQHESHPAIAEALAHDLIHGLSRMRWLRVISRGTAFRFQDNQDTLGQVKAKLDVRYCLTGVVELNAPAITINVRLIDLDNDTEIWVDRFQGTLDDIHELRAAIVSQSLASIDTKITQHEAQRSQFVATENLDAWSAYHLGLVNAYRFSESSTNAAVEYFSRAIDLDPHFARAHAGLSFATYQNAFNRYPGVDRDAEVKRTVAAAERGLELDALDPFCNFVRGRAFMLTEEMEQAHVVLDRATEINPNFAQGHYSRGVAAFLVGESKIPVMSADKAVSLSPLDPLLFGFYGVRGFASLLDGDYEESAKWMVRSATSPGSLVVMDLGAVAANVLAGNTDAAEKWAARARARNPNASSDYLFKALPFQVPETRKLLSDALAKHSF